MTNSYKIVTEKREGKRRLGKPECRWQDNINIKHKEARRGFMDLPHLIHDRAECQAVVNRY